MMSQIQIDVTPEQFARLAAGATRAGKSLGDYMLERALQAEDEARALYELETFLEPRIDEARAGMFTSKSPGEIAREVFKELGV